MIVCTMRNLNTLAVQHSFRDRGTLFPGRHKPIPRGLTAAVRVADTREKSAPASLELEKLSLGGITMRKD